MANTTKSIEQILSQDGQTLTPYEVYRVWQYAVSKIDSQRELKPQMAYNYDRNGLIVKGRSSKATGSAGRYTADEALAFVAKWIHKNYNRTIAEIMQPSKPENEECEGQLELVEM